MSCRVLFHAQAPGEQYKTVFDFRQQLLCNAKYAVCTNLRRKFRRYAQRRVIQIGYKRVIKCGKRRRDHDKRQNSQEHAPRARRAGAGRLSRRLVRALFAECAHVAPPRRERAALLHKARLHPRLHPGRGLGPAQAPLGQGRRRGAGHIHRGRAQLYPQRGRDAAPRKRQKPRPRGPRPLRVTAECAAGQPHRAAERRPGQ